MTWTAEIVGKQQDVGYVEFAVRYSDGTKSKQELIRANTETDLKYRIADTIERLNASDVVFQTPTGPITATKPTDTVEDTAFNTWLRKLNRLRRVQELITLGVLTGNEAAVTNLRNDVKDTLQVAYINRF